MKFLKTIICISILAVSSSVLAHEDYDRFRDYDADYYDDEGKLLFKIRPFFANIEGKQSSFPARNPGADTKIKDLVENGYGFDTATTYFFTDNFAVELALGVTFIRVKTSALNSIEANFGNGTGSAGKENHIWMFPLSAAVQYHVAPFGAVRPYVGLGVHGTHAYTRSKAFSVENGTGVVVQAGIDFVARDDTFFTLDIRHMAFESKIKYKEALLGTGRSATSKVKWNPTFFSLGFGFIF